MATAPQQAFREYHLRREAEDLAQREARRLALLAQVREAVSLVAPRYPAIHRVYIFGSLLQPGRFGPDSDVDLAIDCDHIESETPFWREMEQALRRNVDLRTRQGAVAEAVAVHGELSYAPEHDPP